MNISSTKKIQLELTIDDVKWAIVATKKMKIKQEVSPKSFSADLVGTPHFEKELIGNNCYPS